MRPLLLDFAKGDRRCPTRSPDPFSRLIPDARAFLAELAADNDRDWFAAHKDRYEAQLKAPALLLLDQVVHDADRAHGLTLTPKLFRAQRDTRFSNDKTPYHTRPHMMWTPGGTGPQRPALFFGIAPGYATTGGGVMGFDKASLDAWRRAVDGPDGDWLDRQAATLTPQDFRLDPAELKRVPAPWDAAHPRAGLLRRKSLILWRDIPQDGWPAPLAALLACLSDLRPLIERLDRLA